MALEDTLAKIYKLPQGSMGKIASTGGPYMQETGAAVPASALDYVPSMKDRIVDNLPLVPEPMERMMMSDQYKDFDSEKRNFMNKILRRETGAVVNDSELDYLDQTYFPQMGDTPETIETKRQAREQAEMGLQQDETRRAIDQLSFEMQRAEDPEERDGLMRMIEKLQVQSMAPMGEMAQQLAQAGGGEDTMLAHLRPGEIVLPPEMMEDPEFETMVETKFNQLGINPAQAVAGVGIASLNESTGLEQFGFFKKIGKSLKKVVKKVAPIAAFIPGVGTALGGVLGGIGGGIGGALGMSGTTGLGGLITKGIKGIGSLGIPGISSIAGGASAGNFGGIMDALTTKSGLLGGGMFGETGSSYFGGPEAGKGLANRFGMGSGTEAQVEAFEKAQRAKTFLETLPPEQLAAMDPADLEKIRAAAAGGSGTGIGSNIRSIFGGGSGGSGGIGSIFGGGGQGGGLGGLAGMAGAGALAASLGKLAYDEAKDAKGVSLSPVVAMDATGRYNLEAEMARRMGQQAPNPVEFGLLPQGTLPELSGGKPREPQPMMYGGAVEDLTGGRARGLMYGGSVMPMAYAEGGNVAMEDFERKNGFIDGPGTETSDDIPAMLSDGEFVMTGRAVRGAGSYDMNNNQGILTLTPNGGPDRENGTELMYQLMEAFSGQARPA